MLGSLWVIQILNFFLFLSKFFFSLDCLLLFSHDLTHSGLCQVLASCSCLLCLLSSFVLFVLQLLLFSCSQFFWWLRLCLGIDFCFWISCTFLLELWIFFRVFHCCFIWYFLYNFCFSLGLSLRKIFCLQVQAFHHIDVVWDYVICFNLLQSYFFSEEDGVDFTIG